MYSVRFYILCENEELTAQIAESRADIQILKDDKEQAIREKQEAEQRAEDAEKEDFLMPVSAKLWCPFLFLSNQLHKE